MLKAVAAISPLFRTCEDTARFTRARAAITHLPMTTRSRDRRLLLLIRSFDRSVQRACEDCAQLAPIDRQAYGSGWLYIFFNDDRLLRLDTPNFRQRKDSWTACLLACLLARRIWRMGQPHTEVQACMSTLRGIWAGMPDMACLGRPFYICTAAQKVQWNESFAQSLSVRSLCTLRR